MFLTFAHQIWKNHLKSGAIAIDATAGNGYDTEVLSKLPLSRLYVFDIQNQAIEETQKRVGTPSHLSFHQTCHSKFEGVKGSVHLIVYNLGYLPGADKTVTTRVETTLASLSTAIDLLDREGLISIMLYPGHPEGLKEKVALFEWAQTLSPKKFQISHHRAVNRSKAPSLLLIQKVL